MSQGLIVSVYRNARLSGCTNGPTAQADEVLLVGPKVPPVFEANGRPAFMLVRGVLGRTIAVPADAENHGHLMFGGNFISSSDSRFSEAARQIDPQWNGWTIPVFDRDETLSFSLSRYHHFTAAQEEGGSYIFIRHFALKVEEVIVPDSALEMIIANQFENPQRDGDVFTSEDGKTTLRPLNHRELSYQEFSTLKQCSIDSYEVTEAAYHAWATSRGDLDAAVIYSHKDDDSGCGDSVYWDQERQQWGGLKFATRYTRNERRLLRPHRMPKSLRMQASNDKPSFVDVVSIAAPVVEC